MTHPNADSLTPDDLSTYRRARFGDAGRCGREGVAKAGRAHGVSVRAWYFYEDGRRRPKVTERRKIARWLVLHARKESVRAEVESHIGARTVEDTSSTHPRTVPRGAADTVR